MNNMEEICDFVEKFQVESYSYPHGIICSEETVRLLKNEFESISRNKVNSILYLDGIPICAEKYFIEDKLWILNKELWEIYLKDGLAGLIKHMAIKSVKRRKK